MLECITGFVSEVPLAVIILTGPKHCRTLQKQTFMSRFNHFDLNQAGAGAFQSDLKTQDIMLTKFLPMPGILPIIRGTYRSQLKFIYLKKQNPFVDILMYFQNLYKVLNILKKKLSLIAYVFQSYLLEKTWILECIAGLVSEHRPQSMC